MNDTQQLQVVPQQPMQLAVADLVAQNQLIQQAIKQVMIPGHHFGVIPGTEAKSGEKERPPVLLKPGAEKLCSLFRLAPSFDVKTKDLPGGHREERVTCTLTHITTGSVVATALGSCSTMEAKYRYRNGKPKCPECGAETILKSKKDSEFFCWQKKGGCGATFPLSDKRISEQQIGLTENRDLADVFNTVLKMAVKRAHIAAVLLATAASDAFVIEEDAEDEDEHEEKPRGKGGKREPERQQQRRDDPPPAGDGKDGVKLDLANDCAKMASDLGLEAGPLKQWLGENGVPKFEKWRDLDEPTLLKVRGLLLAQLRAGKPAGGQS